jgi:hypothetical protein
MADVFVLADHRKKAPPPPPRDVAMFCVAAIMDEWERFAKSNKLSDFVNSQLGSHAKPFINYLTNLNELSVIEQQLSLCPGILAPGINGPGQIGWRASFRFGDEIIETPDMAFEAHARAANILIFQKLRREMVQQNRPAP